MYESKFELCNEICKHDIMEDGVCTLCGECLDDTMYITDFTVTTNKYSNDRMMKYKVKNENFDCEKAVLNILTSLGLTNYKSIVIKMMTDIKFDYKISKEDKIILILYYILKKDGFPITTADLLKFSKMKKSRFLKILRNTFGTFLSSKEYLKSIYDRINHFSQEKNIKLNFSFNLFYSYKEKYPTIDSYNLCLACLVIYSKAPLKILGLESKNDYEKIRKIIKKLKNSLIFSDKDG